MNLYIDIPSCELCWNQDLYHFQCTALLLYYSGTVLASHNLHLLPNIMISQSNLINLFILVSFPSRIDFSKYLVSKVSKFQQAFVALRILCPYIVTSDIKMFPHHWVFGNNSWNFQQWFQPFRAPITNLLKILWKLEKL